MQAHFTLMVCLGVLRVIHSAFIRSKTPTIHWLGAIYISMLVLAAISWQIDHHFCAALSNGAIVNPQLHAWWHVFCGLSSHYGVVMVASIRQRVLERPVRLTRPLYLLPFVDNSVPE